MTSTLSTRYSAPAIALHWLLAVAIIGTFCVGVYMHDLPISPSRIRLFNWHKWAGITILALSALRLLWRLSHRPPPDLPMPAWQAAAAHAVHWALYLLFFSVPLVGWAYSSAAGFPISLFGVLPLPDFVPRDQDLADAIKPWHGWLAWALAALVAAHVAAVVKHRFLDRDTTLDRMWPRRRTTV